MSSQKTWYIEKANLLSKMSPEALAMLHQKGTRLKFTRTECLVPLEEATPCVFVLLEGFAKLVTMNVEGKRFSISILQAGDFLGPIIALQTYEQDAEQSEFLEAMSDIQVLRVQSDHFSEVLNNNPTLYVTVLQILQGKTRHIQRKLSDMLFKDVYARIAQLFLDMIFAHGEACPYAFGLNKDIVLKHHEIAELIGASRPATSVALSRFAKADLIHKHDGFICLQDLSQLRQVAESGYPAFVNLEYKMAIVR